MELEKMINIGSGLAKRLNDAGVNCAEDLISIGSKQAFLKTKAIYPDACINSLFALEGAIRNIRWHHLPSKVKSDLKEFNDAV